ncbi:unnamed protein product [Amoebophrya sp. A120]|nr:unnamed protein product [Amoebophrya sp. A120]|eukprot:GSA120T00017673001.1
MGMGGRSAMKKKESGITSGPTKSLSVTDLDQIRVRVEANRREKEALAEALKAERAKGPIRRVLVTLGLEKGCVEWISRPQADIFFACMILVNALVLAIETDNRTEANEDDIGWFISDSFFNVIFLFELFLRICYAPCGWYRDIWNCFDLLLVTVGVLDTWVLRFAAADEDSDLRSVTVLRIFRLLRLVRVLRLVRLFRFLRELVLLAKGIIGSFRALLWTGVLLGVALFMCGMFLTRLIGQDCCEEGDTFQDHEVKKYFGTLLGSFFTLFQIMTLEQWGYIARLVMNDAPALGLFFVCFILLTNMAIFNLVTAIIVDNVVEISRDMEEEAMIKIEEEKMRNLDMVRKLYHDTDKDGNGTINREELADAPAEYVAQAFGSTAKQEELFNILDVDNRGEIVIDDLVRAAMQVREPVNSTQMLTIEKDVARARLEIETLKHALNVNTKAAQAAQHENFEKYLRRVISDEVRRTMASVLADTKAAVQYL